jgi:hypothetical protein
MCAIDELNKWHLITIINQKSKGVKNLNIEEHEHVELRNPIGKGAIGSYARGTKM